MANKRIELEQYKYYVDLVKEEPPRKRARTGAVWAMVVAILLALMILVLGILSNGLAKNKRNVLEKPPAPASSATQSTQLPNGTELPSGTQIPTGQSPGGGARPTAPKSPSSDSLVPADTVHAMKAMPMTLGGAFAQTSSSPIQIQSTSAPSSSPSSAPKGKQLSTETTNIGNLGNVANGAGGKGFGLYLIVLFVIIGILMYLGIRTLGKEAKKR